MSIFVKRPLSGQLPPALRESVLLTTSLAGVLRTQYLVAGMTTLGMILGAALAAWLVGFAPLLWNSADINIMFSAVDTLSILSWVGRGVGVAMGAFVGSTFFRHVTYTAVANTLLALKQRPEATDMEKAWLDFELASMVKELSASIWINAVSLSEITFRVVLSVIWLGFALLVFDASTLYTNVMWTQYWQAMAFVCVFVIAWSFAFSAPTIVLKIEAAQGAVCSIIGEEFLTPVLQHRKSKTDDHCGFVILTFVVALILSVAIPLVRDDIRKDAEDAQRASTIKALGQSTNEQNKNELVKSLRTTQYAGQKLNWAVYVSLADALAPNTPFKEIHCHRVEAIGTSPYLCASDDLTKSALIELKLTSADWHMFYTRMQ
jgi:hypothetical protein